MIATKNETVFDTAKNRLHTAPVCVDARRARIVKVAAVNGAPEVRIEFEIGATPFALHGAKQGLEMLLHFRVCTVEHVPWATTPAAKRYAIRAQWFAVVVFHKPIRMLLNHARLFFRNERREPDRRFKASFAHLFQHALHVAAKCSAGLEPVGHRRLIAIVDLHVTQQGRLFGDEVEIIEHLLRRYARTKTVPRAPPGWRRGKTQWRMVSDKLGSECFE